MSATAAHLSTPHTTRYTAVLPARLAEPRPSTQVYLRRRLLVAAVLLAVVVAVWGGAGNVLANRDGAPASAVAARQAISYVVQPGDTLWSIAAAHHGSVGQVDYVDLLVNRNGGATIQVGQVITLP
ncbi:MAG: LysM peptidoglycan-binding domain-containing protein [Ilumatobacteraceae bacterium]|jgi:LysM repeat protein